MPNVITMPRVRDYLNDLDRGLRELNLPADRRKEIVRDIRFHIETGLAEVPTPSAAHLESILDDLGSPDTIAAAASAEMPAAKQRMALRDVATIILLLIGGLVFPVVGWLIGAVMLWTSEAWRSKDKVIATLLLPGGLLAPLLLVPYFLLAARTAVPTSCAQSAVLDPVQSPSPTPLGVAHTAAVDACTGGSGSIILPILVLVLSFGGPLFSTFWLIRHARRLGAQA